MARETAAFLSLSFAADVRFVRIWTSEDDRWLLGFLLMILFCGAFDLANDERDDDEVMAMACRDRARWGRAIVSKDRERRRGKLEVLTAS